MLLLSLTSPIQFAVFILAIVLSLTIHEFAHAFTAVKLGDDTPKLMGRLTLNPLAHLDLWGTIFLFLAGFGWGKPVIVNPNAFKNPILDNVTTSLAGPMSNLLMALIFGLVLRFLNLPPLAESILTIFIFFNLVFMIFNLLPIPPLDGSKVLSLFLPHETYEALQQMGIILLFGFILFSSFVYPIIPLIVNRVVNFFFMLFTGQSAII